MRSESSETLQICIQCRRNKHQVYDDNSVPHIYCAGGFVLRLLVVVCMAKALRLFKHDDGHERIGVLYCGDERDGESTCI